MENISIYDNGGKSYDRLTGITNRVSNILIELRLYDESGKYLESIYSRKIISIYQYCKEQNIKITVNK